MRALSVVVTLSVAVLATGCTITTHGGEPQPPQAQARPAPAQQQPQQEKPQQGTTARRPGLFRPSPGGGGAAGGSAPRVTSATPFGGPQVAAFRGLAYVVPDGTKTMPDVTTMVPFALLHTDSFNVASQNFQSGFPGALDGQVENFALRYTGKFAVPSDGSYQFKLVSDDGAILYVDGVKVVDNDGLHTEKAATGQATLKTGNHELKLDYFQAKGPVALQVFLVTNGQDRLLTGTR